MAHKGWLPSKISAHAALVTWSHLYSRVKPEFVPCGTERGAGANGQEIPPRCSNWPSYHLDITRRTRGFQGPSGELFDVHSCHREEINN